MTMSPAGGRSPAETSVRVTTPEPRIVLARGGALRLTDKRVIDAMARKLGCGALKLTTRDTIRRQRYKCWAGAAIAFYRNKMAIAAAETTIVHAISLGGRMTRMEVPSNSIRVVDVGGAGLKLSVNVWSNGMCGPIRTSNPAAELAESQFAQLSVSDSQRWCAPLSQTKKFVCRRCCRRFATESQLWDHGDVPADVEHLSQRLPRYPLWRGPPPLKLSQGSIASPLAAANAERLIRRLANLR